MSIISSCKIYTHVKLFTTIKSGQNYIQFKIGSPEIQSQCRLMEHSPCYLAQACTSDQRSKRARAADYFLILYFYMVSAWPLTTFSSNFPHSFSLFGVSRRVSMPTSHSSFQNERTTTRNATTQPNGYI